MHIHKTQTAKPISRFVSDLTHAANSRDFQIHNQETMEMAHTFARHDAEVADDFDLHMIQICKPKKAAKSLSKNLERSVLMPKFIMTFSDEGMTQVRFMYYSQETVSRLVDDEEFPESVTASYAEIISLIEEAL